MRGKALVIRLRFVLLATGCSFFLLTLSATYRGYSECGREMWCTPHPGVDSLAELVNAALICCCLMGPGLILYGITWPSKPPPKV